jgi:hypothetical protein
VTSEIKDLAWNEHQCLSAERASVHAAPQEEGLTSDRQFALKLVVKILDAAAAVGQSEGEVMVPVCLGLDCACPPGYRQTCPRLAPGQRLFVSASRLPDSGQPLSRIGNCPSLLIEGARNA